MDAVKQCKTKDEHEMRERKEALMLTVASQPAQTAQSCEEDKSKFFF